MPGDGHQVGIASDDSRMPDGFQQRQVGEMITVGIAIARQRITLFEEIDHRLAFASPVGLWWQQFAGKPALLDFETIC